MKNKREVASPLNDAIEEVNNFLGLPQLKKLQCNRIDIVKKKNLPTLLITKSKNQYIKSILYYYKRIDTTDKEQLKALAEDKLTLHIKKKYNSFKRFIEDEIRIARIKQNWFNKVLDVTNYYDLENYIDYLENEFKENAPQQSVDIPTIGIVETIQYNANHFNEDCKLLFDYLIEHYHKNAKVKYINIYYFIKKYIAIKQQEKYLFSIIQVDYKKFILTDYGVKLSKFETAKIEFEENEVPKLKELTKKFKQTLK